jgi:hypothetical protein
MLIVWKVEYNHSMLQHISKFPSSLTIKTYIVHYFWKIPCGHVLQVLPKWIFARKIKCLLCWFKMNDILDLNLWNIWDVIRDVWNMYHKSSPFSNMKMLKLSQFSNNWSLASLVVIKEYHQQWITTYWTSTSSKEITFLYS